MEINAIREWTWLLTESLGQAYGEYKKDNDIKVVTIPAAEPFFYFANNIEIIKDPKISHIHNNNQNIYNKDFIPRASWGESWTPPPLKDHYKKISKINSEHPILVINNKYTNEWSQGPVNFLDLEFLSNCFETFKNKFKIFYIRYNGNVKGYYDDVNVHEFQDYELVKDHPYVTTIYDVIEEYGYGYNEAQLNILSKSDHHITTNGGNAVISSYFGGDVFMYGYGNCRSTNRGIWQTDSWLKFLNQESNIFGYTDYNLLLNNCKEKWL